MRKFAKRQEVTFPQKFLFERLYYVLYFTNHLYMYPIAGNL